MYGPKAKALAGAALAAASLTLAAASSAQVPPRQTLEVLYTTTRPGDSTGLSERIRYTNPSDPQRKPPAVEKIVLRLARGAVIDTSVPERCAAPDPALILRGPSACQDRSRVGEGEVVLDSGGVGPGRFVQTDVTLLNAAGELIFVFEERDSGARTVSRSEVAGRGFVTEVPPLPGGPPDGFTAIKRVRLDVRPVARGGNAYITTPERCPGADRWLTTGAFIYRDGVTQTVESATPCGSARDRPPACGRKRTTLVGTPGADVLRGTAGRDVIRARGGDDIVRARRGRDVVCSGRGEDLVRAGRGRDLAHGGRGADALRGGPGVDRLRGGRGADSIGGGSGGDHCGGSAGRDRLRGCERPSS